MPEETRAYRIQTVGEADTKVALLDFDEAGISRVLGVADDSAKSSNASLTTQLTAGNRYHIAVRTHYAGHPSGASVVVL